MAGEVRDSDPDRETTQSQEALLAQAICTTGTAGFFPALSRYLRAISPFRGVLIVLFRNGKPPEHVYDNVRTERRLVVVDHYLNGAYLLDPFYDCFKKNPGTSAMRLRDVAPDRFQHSTYFKRYYSQLRLRDEMAIFVPLTPRRTLFISLGRYLEETRFLRREVEAFQKALPIVRALAESHFGGRLHDAGDEEPHLQMDDAVTQFGLNVLTARERQIAGMILKGHSTLSIAERTGIAVGTVKIHRKNLYRKLGISSQAELFSRFLATVFD